MKINKPGKFITLEGGEGSGKTTNIKFLQTWLAEQGIEAIITHEPGGTPLAEKIRDLLLDKTLDNITYDTELLLMFAARAQHLAELIKPSLAAGKWVLCSRFTDSTYAYQGGGRGIAYERIATLEAWVQQGFQPDLTLLFDLPVEQGMARASSRAELDRIEQEDLSFFQRVQQAFLQRAEQYERYRIIDASTSLEQVQKQLITVMAGLL